MPLSQPFLWRLQLLKSILLLIKAYLIRDHKASINPKELNLVENIRKVDLAKGSSIKKSTKSEIKNKKCSEKIYCCN